MSTFTVTTECGTSGDFETIRDAEAGKRTHEMLCSECDEDEIAIEAAPGQSTLDEGNGDGGDVGTPAGNGTVASAIEADEAETRERPPARGDQDRGDRNRGDRDRTSLDDAMPDTVRTDPLDVVPEYMIDEVEGQPTINKRGYAVIANHFDIVVNAEPITTAGETDHEYAEFRATAWQRGDDPEQAYTGHATARASEDRANIADNLNEMAETRAMKRAVAWASGVGILAWEEMAGYLDGESEA